jgi:hypothetical protein
MKRSAQRYLDKELVAGSDAACLNNEAFAFCKVRLADGEKRFFLVALVTGDPIRLRLLPIPGSD